MASILPFIVFIVSVVGMLFCMIRSPQLPVPKSIVKRGHIHVDSVVPPLIGVIILLISGEMSFREMWNGGVVGDDKIKPYAIIIIFNALAYICVSLDATGCLTYISLKVAKAAGSSRKRLFVYFFLLSAALTAVTSNDIVIMTLTPVVLQCAKFTGTAPWAYLFAEFIAANTTSFALVIGNPTNIIVADAFNINFAEFSKIMVVPALFTTALEGLVLYWLFSRDLEGTFVPPDLHPEEMLLDPLGSKVHGVILGICVIFMGVSSAIPDIKLWMVAACCCVFSIIYNVYAYPWSSEEAEAREAAIARISEAAQDGTAPAPVGASDDDTEVVTQTSNIASEAASVPATIYSPPANDVATINGRSSVEIYHDSVSSSQSHRDLSLNPNSPIETMNLDHDHKIARQPVKPTIKAGIKALPWGLIPFVFSMFVLVQGLNNGGWVDKIAEACVSAMGGKGSINSASAPQFVPALFMMFVTCIFCNLLNNQPATVLITRVLLAPPFQALKRKAQLGAAYAVIAGSNLAASLTLVGALAGIMFIQLLKLHGRPMTYSQFALVGLKVVPFVALCCCVVVSAFIFAA